MPDPLALARSLEQTLHALLDGPLHPLPNARELAIYRGALKRAKHVHVPIASHELFKGTEPLNARSIDGLLPWMEEHFTLDQGAILVSDASSLVALADRAPIPRAGLRHLRLFVEIQPPGELVSQESFLYPRPLNEAELERALDRLGRGWFSVDYGVLSFVQPREGIVACQVLGVLQYRPFTSEYRVLEGLQRDQKFVESVAYNARDAFVELGYLMRTQQLDSCCVRPS